MTVMHTTAAIPTGALYKLFELHSLFLNFATCQFSEIKGTGTEIVLK